MLLSVPPPAGGASPVSSRRATTFVLETRQKERKR